LQTSRGNLRPVAGFCQGEGDATERPAPENRIVSLSEWRQVDIYTVKDTHRSLSWLLPKNQMASLDTESRAPSENKNRESSCWSSDFSVTVVTGFAKLGFPSPTATQHGDPVLEHLLLLTRTMYKVRVSIYIFPLY